MSKHVVTAFSYTLEDEDIIKKAKETATREGKSLSNLIVELLKEHVKVHGNGNPAYTLDQWKDPNFKCVPAFLTKIENWESYLANCKPEEIREIKDKASAIKRMIEKRFPL